MRGLVILLWVIVYPVLFYLQCIVAIALQFVLTDRPSGGIVGTLGLFALWSSWALTKALRKKVLPSQTSVKDGAHMKY